MVRENCCGEHTFCELFIYFFLEQNDECFVTAILTI